MQLILPLRGRKKNKEKRCMKNQRKQNKDSSASSRPAGISSESLIFLTGRYIFEITEMDSSKGPILNKKKLF